MLYIFAVSVLALNLNFKFPSVSYREYFITGSGADAWTTNHYPASLTVQMRLSAKCANGVVNTIKFIAPLKSFRGPTITQYSLRYFDAPRICGPLDGNPLGTKQVIDIYFHTMERTDMSRCIGTWNPYGYNGLGLYTITQCAWLKYNQAFMSTPTPGDVLPTPLPPTRPKPATP